MLKVNLDQPVLAMFVRFVIKEFVEWPCMRVEVYGTPASKSLKRIGKLFNRSKIAWSQSFI